MNRMFVNIVKTNTITFCARVFIVVILVVFLHSASGWSYEVILHFINNAREFMLTFRRQVIQWTKWGVNEKKEKKCKKNAKILVAHVFAQVFIRSFVLLVLLLFGVYSNKNEWTVYSFRVNLLWLCRVENDLTQIICISNEIERWTVCYATHVYKWPNVANKGIQK